MSATNAVTTQIKPIEQFLSTSEAAQFLKTHPQSLKTSRSTGQLFGRKAPKHRRVGDKKIIYEAQTLIDWVLSAPEEIITTSPEPNHLAEHREGAIS